MKREDAQEVSFCEGGGDLCDRGDDRLNRVFCMLEIITFGKKKFITVSFW